MARGKTTQGSEQAADLATFANEHSKFYGTATVPAGARVLIEAKGNRLISLKLIDQSLEPITWNIRPARQTASSMA